MNKIIYNISKYIPDKIYLQLMYYKHFDKFIDFRNPKTFNEKINWLKLYNRRPEYTQMVDKYAVREYIAEKLGEEYLIPLLGVWDDPHEIDFDNLPNQFVLKWNHDSGSVVICKDKTKLNITETVAMLASKKSHNGYWYGREWPYKNVKPRIIAEKYLNGDNNTGLRDFKIFCFNNDPKITLVCSDRFTKQGLREDFFDENWCHLPVKRPERPCSESIIDKPINFEQMKELARQLSKDMPFVRTDFYEINGKIFFGELTFYPASGFSGFDPEYWDQKLGEWVILPEKFGGGTLL